MKEKIKLYTIKEVSEKLGIPLRTLYFYSYANKIQSVVPGRCLYDESVFDILKKIWKPYPGRPRKK